MILYPRKKKRFFSRRKGFILLLALFFFFGSSFILPRYGEKIFLENPADEIDLIVVLTGDKGRIEHGFSQYQKYPYSSIFISGVHSGNYTEKLLKLFNGSHTKIEKDKIKIDRWAKNTFENIAAISIYLKNNPHYNNILVVSSSYHIARVKLLLSLLNKNTKAHFYFSGPRFNYLNLRNWKILLKENIKLLKTSITALFWNTIEVNEDIMSI